jgi:hypothetical protein
MTGIEVTTDPGAVGVDAGRLERIDRRLALVGSYTRHCSTEPGLGNLQPTCRVC